MSSMYMLKVHVNNCGGRSIGFINYEADIWGRKNLDSVFKKMMLYI